MDIAWTLTVLLLTFKSVTLVKGEEGTPTDFTLDDLTTILDSFPTASTDIRNLTVKGVEMTVKTNNDSRLVATIKLTPKQKSIIREMLEEKNRQKQLLSDELKESQDRALKKIPATMTVSGENLDNLKFIVSTVLAEMKKHDLTNSGSERSEVISPNESDQFGDYGGSDYDFDEDPFDILAEFSDIFGKKIGRYTDISHNGILQPPRENKTAEPIKNTRKIVLNINKKGKKTPQKPINSKEEDLQLPDEVDAEIQTDHSSNAPSAATENTTSVLELVLSSSTSVPVVFQQGGSTGSVSNEPHLLTTTRSIGTFKPITDISAVKPTSFFSKKVIPTRKHGKEIFTTNNPRFTEKLTSATPVKPTTYKPTSRILKSNRRILEPKQNITTSAPSRSSTPNLLKHVVKKTLGKKLVQEPHVTTTPSTPSSKTNENSFSQTNDVKNDLDNRGLFLKLAYVPKEEPKDTVTTPKQFTASITKSPWRTAATPSKSPIGSLNTFFQTDDLPSSITTPRLNTIIIDFHKHRHDDYDYDDYSDFVYPTTPIVPRLSSTKATNGHLDDAIPRRHHISTHAPISITTPHTKPPLQDISSRKPKVFSPPTTPVQQNIDDDSIKGRYTPPNLSKDAARVTGTPSHWPTNITPSVASLPAQRGPSVPNNLSTVSDDISLRSVTTSTPDFLNIHNTSQGESGEVTVTDNDENVDDVTVPITYLTTRLPIFSTTSLVKKRVKTSKPTLLDQQTSRLPTERSKPTARSEETNSRDNRTQSFIKNDVLKLTTKGLVTNKVTSQARNKNIETTTRDVGQRTRSTTVTPAVTSTTQSESVSTRATPITSPKPSSPTPLSRSLRKFSTEKPSSTDTPDDRTAHKITTDNFSSNNSLLNHTFETHDDVQLHKSSLTNSFEPVSNDFTLGFDKEDHEKPRKGTPILDKGSPVALNKTTSSTKSVEEKFPNKSEKSKKMTVSTSMFLPGISSSKLNKFDALEAQLMSRRSKFECQKRNPGFYADIEVDCQIWYWCVNDGSKYAFICPEGTAFDQQQFICNWKDRVDCLDSPDFFHLNQDVQIENNQL